MPKFAPTPWRLRNEALVPCAVLALGSLARARLQSRLHTQDAAELAADTHYQQLDFSFPGTDEHGDAAGLAPGVLLWLTPNGTRSHAALPWFDGALYVGAALECPQLWLPCSHAPALPPEWLHAAAQRRTSAAKHLIWHAPALLIALP